MAKTIYRDEYVTFLRLLREHRRAANLTQAECSAALKRPQSYISDIERGTRRLDVVQLRDLCSVLQTNLVEFITRFESELSGTPKGTAARRKPRKHR